MSSWFPKVLFLAAELVLVWKNLEQIQPDFHFTQNKIILKHSENIKPLPHVVSACDILLVKGTSKWPQKAHLGFSLIH